MTSPLVSVIMNAYNAERYLPQAIESILNQTYRDFEFLITNDGSSDKTSDIITAFAQQDARIVPIHHDNMGISKSANLALAKAKGVLIARMDADDISLPNRFAAQIDFLSRNQAIMALGTAIDVIDETGTVLYTHSYETRPEKLAHDVLLYCPIANPSAMLRKNVLQEMGGYRAIFDPAEDYDIWLRLCERYPIANLPDVHLQYRHHITNASAVKVHRQTLNARVAVLASRERRADRPDPTNNLNDINDTTLDLFPLSQAEKAHIQLDINNHVIGQMIKNNHQTQDINHYLARSAEVVRQADSIKSYLSSVVKVVEFHGRNKRYKDMAQIILQTVLNYPLKSVSFITNVLWRRIRH